MNINLTEIVFLLDRSGSMAGLEKDTIGGFNAFIQKQCQLEGETRVTAVLFDDQYEVLWDGVEAPAARLSDQYYVRGCTALLDAAGKTIVDVGHRLSRTSEENRPGKVIFVITTDGEENASTEFTYDKVKQLIQHQQEKYNWEFIFMGANIDAVAEAGSLGIENSRAYQFMGTEKGIESMYDTVFETVAEIRRK
ncbi:vWA domain-containing protein [Bacillus sp. FJAT-27251]|uniref:vWA domain-containing protein n=1 Tax=Bacillus sp. FJAT-27251 TaxID=1684142 RepID=UPI0006A7C2B5|nr:vWA domain-containing protein [Bacillus sp. FJAT-27251]